MDTIKALLVILMSSVLVNNYVLNKFLGICPFLGVSKKLDQAAGMGTAVTFVMLVATAVTWPIQTFVLDKLGLGYLQTIVFILVIATLVQFVTFRRSTSRWAFTFRSSPQTALSSALPSTISRTATASSSPW